MSRAKLIAYCVIWTLSTFSQAAEDVCPNEQDGQVRWPDTNSLDCSRSNPFCLSDDMEILSRCCDSEGRWADAPSCASYQDTITNPCPDRFDWKSDICIFVIEDSVYPPECPYKENLPFARYISLLDSQLFPIWMPVTRNIEDYGVDLFRWIEPTLNYKSAYEDFYAESITGNNCLIYHNSSFAEAVSCDEKHTAICAYQTLTNRPRSFCYQILPPCIQSDYSTYSKCFCQTRLNQSSLALRAEFQEPYQNLLYSSLNDTCYIGLERVSDSYFWINSNENIAYSNWAESTVFHEDYKYGAVTPNGWVTLKTRNETDCAIYEVEILTGSSKIALDYDDDQFVLKLTNPNSWLFEEDQSMPKIFCFTDVASDSLISKINVTLSTISGDEAQFYFQKHPDGPGNYWCEAFLYPALVAKSSNKYLLRYNDTYTEEYVIILTKTYAKETNPITESRLQEYRKLLADQVESFPDISQFQVRIYKIVDVDEPNSLITINFHIANPNQNKAFTSYGTIRNYMEHKLTDFTFVNILDVDSCVGIQTSASVTWPLSPINTVARPREGYCIGSDGSIVNRHCFGSYVDGANWLDLDEPCTIQQFTNATVNLTNILNMNNTREYMEQVVDISKNYLELEAQDIELISHFLEQVTYSDYINLTSVSIIINQLMEVPRKILKQSQASSNSTDRILHQLSNIIHRSGYIGEITGENFYIISSYAKEHNLNAIVVEQHNVYKECNVLDLDEILDIDHLKAALFLSDTLTSQLQEEDLLNSKIIVTIFKNSNLFNEIDQRTKITDVTFGVTFPYLPEITGEISTVYRVLNSEEDVSCSFWEYDLNEKKGYWTETKTSNSNTSITCTYDSSMHFTLVRNEEVNITHELETLINSDDILSEKLEDTFLLLINYYLDFQPIDLQLVSQLLHMAAQVQDEDNLDLVTDIINVIIIIPKEVLEKSQKTYNATGKILFYFDQIVQNSASSQIIKKDHVYAVVQHLREDLFYGFTLEECDGRYEFKLLEEETTVEEISVMENLDTAMLISREMLDQLLMCDKEEYTPKIVMIIFFKDSLFIEDYPNSRIKTKVVGVSFPDFDDAQNGDITLLFNLDSNISLNYSCSVYQSDTDDATVIRGFWNTESPAISKRSIQVCEFWKPTYFSLIYNLVNLTAYLESMLESTEDIEVILNNINSITGYYYEHLKPIDVFLIAQLLSKVEDVNEIILEVCSTIVNDITKVSKVVLQISQDNYNSTNLLVDTFNHIAGNYDKNKEIYKSNIVLVISLLEETGMYGIRLENCSQHCSVVILNNDSPLFQKTQLKTLDAELTLSTNLVDSLINAKNESYTPKLVLIIFYSDVFFIEKDNSRNTSKIFGIHFPNYAEPLSDEMELSLQQSTRSSSEYTCVSWLFRDENTDNNEGTWSYESRIRNNDAVSCNFYAQNYFAITDGTIIIENVTQTLEHILNSKMSFTEKLYRAQDISYYYMKFLPCDVYQFSEILMQCYKLNQDGLDMVSVIVNNILRTPQEVLLNSMVEYDALKHILQGIRHVSSFETSREYSPREGQFGVVICRLESGSTNVVIVTSDDIECKHEEDDAAFADYEDVVASLILNKEVAAQIIETEENARMVVSVFSNNIFFNMEEIQNSTLVLGLSIPSLQEDLEGELIVLYNNTVYNTSKYTCGYWKDLAHWKVVNGEELDSFKKCSYTLATYFTLRENTNTNHTIDLTELLKNIINADCTLLEKLQQTSEVLSLYSGQFKAQHVYLISKILSYVENANLKCLEVTANITNSMMNLPRQVLVESQDKYNATDWILYQIDRIAEGIESEVQIEIDKFAIITTYNISGIFVDSCAENCNEDILLDTNLTALYRNSNISTAAAFNTLQEVIQEDASTQVVLTLFFNNALFNEAGGGATYKTIGPIIGVAIPSRSDKLNGTPNFYYYTRSSNSKVCAFWNYNMADDDTIRKGRWEMNQPIVQPSQIAICESRHTTHFALMQSGKNVTSDLENIVNSNSTVREKLEELVAILTESVVKLRPVDIYLISVILEYALEDITNYKMNLTSHVVSTLFQVPRHVLRESQITYHATDKILHTVEMMTKGLTSADVDPIVKDNFTIAVYDLKETNTSGLLLNNCNDIRCNISVLEGSVNLTELAASKHIQTAVALSDELLEQVRQSDGTPKLAITIYFSDVLFNEPSERDGKISMVCGIVLPGLNDSFMGNLYVMFNTAENVDYSNNSCAFWNFQMQDGEEVLEGSWKSDVDPRSKKHFTICEYGHVTHFALLLARDNSNFAYANKYKILDIITAVNSVLSIIGIFGILLTATLFERWRRNTGNQILVHFSIAMSIKMIMLYVSAGVYDDDIRAIICSVTGAILHYAILSEFCWMLIIAILQFKRFVEVLGGPPKFVLLKACICGWVFPILPVLLILLIDRQNYSEGKVGLCYPSGLGLYLGIWLPIVIIVSINFVIFMFIMYNVFHKKTESRDIVNHEILFQWRLALLLFSMLGLTWLFGFMSQIPGAQNIFVFLFCISATLQGFVMFLFFIVFNKSTRFLYSQSIKMWLYSKGYKMH